MREIKFRTWDKENNKMITWDKMWDWQLQDLEPDSAEQLDYIYMQYTGLKDKNGKEIWEGDIVDCRMSFEGGSLPHRGEVVYDETFGAFATKNLSGETLLHNHQLNTLEVIGNIYEEKEKQ